jgi:hypothetical protein
VSTRHADEPCDYEHLAAGAALYALEPEDDEVFSEHLSRCARCQEVLRSSKEAASYLGVGVQQEEPPPELRERILTEAAKTPQVVGDQMPEDDRPPRPRAGEFGPPAEQAEVRRIEPRRRWRARTLVAAAAVVALAVIGGLGVRVLQLSDEQRQMVAASQQVSHALDALGDQGAGMTVLRTPEGRDVATLVSGEHNAAVAPGTLRPTDADHIYVLWGMSGKKPVAVSTFSVQAGSERALQALPWSAAAAKHSQYAISLEQGHSAPAAPTNVVAGGAKPS